MKRLSGILLSIIVCSLQAYSCNTFFIKENGRMVFGRNYDWVTGSGTVNTNLRGLAKTSFQIEEGSNIYWISKYGSVTFNQYGKEFPNGGMNEKGLVVELMWLDETQYPAPDKRAAISVLQWIQYQLDNCATVEEVFATDKKLRIASIGTTPLHYFIADKQGRAATIEFLNGQIVVHQGSDLVFPVLANSTYKESAAHVRDLKQASKYSESSRSSSLGRFTKACSMLEQRSQKKANIPLVDYSFDILDQVAQGDFTKWSIVYDLTKLRIYFKTQSSSNIKAIDFSAFDFACTALPLMFNVNANALGNINDKFSTFSKETNSKVLEQSFVESKQQIAVPLSFTKKLAAYSSNAKCR